MDDLFRSIRWSLLAMVAAAMLAGAAAGSYLAGQSEAATPVVHMTVDMPVTRTYEDYVLVGTPYVDALIDDEQWDELDRESDCLYEYLRMHVGWDISLEAVFAAGAWTDLLGGACAALELER